MFSAIGRLMARLGGADLTVLDQVPQERNRFIQMAGVLLTTSGIAVVSMTFALHNGVGEPLVWALVFGVLWGVVILNLDRFLVLSMGSIRNRGRLLLISLPRFALAVVLALVISTPLVLRIFASDINTQLFTMRLDQSKTQGALEASSNEQKEATKLKTQINIDRATLGGKLPTNVVNIPLQNAQSTVAKLTPQVQAAQKKAVRAREVWQCELYGTGPGCAGASGIPGPGPVAAAKKNLYEDAKASYQGLNKQLTTAENEVAAGKKTLRKSQNSALVVAKAQANKELPGLQSQYNKLAAFLKNEAAQGTQVNDRNHGILAQLQALSIVSKRNPSLNAARLAVLALFFLIEILPVTVKFLLNLGPLTTYESIVKSRDDEITDRANVHRAEERHRSEAESRTRTKEEDNTRSITEGKSKAKRKAEEDMRERELDLSKEANEHVASEMKKVLEVALSEWSARVRAMLKGGPDPAAKGGADPGAAAAGGDPSNNGGGPPHTTHSFGLPGPEHL
jgi:hypothetical protein